MMESRIDFLLPEIARLRLIDATPGDVAAVQRQLGLARVPSEGEADLAVRFVNTFPHHAAMRILGNWEAGYSDDAFWILRGTHGFPIAVQIPMERVGTPCELQCRHSIPALPLLGTLVNLLALAKGFLPLHASAFEFEGEPVLVTGWTKGGKTEALLGFGDQGASYLGDEWIYIDPSNQTLRGVPQPIHLWDWHLDSERYRRCLNWSQRIKLASLRRFQEWTEPFAGWKSPAAKVSQRLAGWFQKSRHVRVTPQQLFGDRIRATAEFPQQLFFMASHASAEIDVQPMAAEEIAARMAISLEEEFTGLVACYRQFRFAFPERTNPLIEQLPALLRRRLADAFRGRQGLVVWHPYPVAPRRLFQAMHRHLRGVELPVSETDQVGVLP
jgi:hypothetical protein